MSCLNLDMLQCVLQEDGVLFIADVSEYAVPGLFHVDGQTDMTKLTVAFRDLASAPDDELSEVGRA